MLQEDQIQAQQEIKDRQAKESEQNICKICFMGLQEEDDEDLQIQSEM